MLIALIGGTRAVQLQILNEMRRGAPEQAQIIHCNLWSVRKDERYSELVYHTLSRRSGDVVTVVTGVESQTEFTKIKSHRAFICIVDGALSRLFTLGAIPIEKSFLYIAPSSAVLTGRKNEQYLRPLQLLSHCMLNHKRVRLRA